MRFHVRIQLVAIIVVILLPVWPASMQTVPLSTRAGALRTSDPVPLFADLKTDWNKPIKLNEVLVASGTSVTTGTLLETPENIGAVIVLKRKTRIRIEPNSKVMLNFTNESAAVDLFNGCASLKAYESFTGAISLPAGKTLTTSPDNGDYIEVCSSGRAMAALPAGSQIPPAGGISPLIYILGGGTSTAVIVATTTSGRNSPLSTFTP